MSKLKKIEPDPTADGQKSGLKAQSDERQARLAEALRQNLARRKQQSRARRDDK